MTGKCGKCDAVVQVARLAHMDVSDGTLRLRAFSANCPKCGTTMGVFPDPRITDDNLGEVLSILKRGR